MTPFINGQVKLITFRVYIIIKITNKMFYTRSHWQLMLICPMDNIVVWFCSLHRKPSPDMKTIV